jgi:hypothetical protein
MGVKHYHDSHVTHKSMPCLRISEPLGRLSLLDDRTVRNSGSSHDGSSVFSSSAA